MSALSTSIPKFWELPPGKIMVVADLHGHWQDFTQVLHLFHKHQAKGKADYLVLLGDLVHAKHAKEDASVAMIDALIQEGCNQVKSNVFALLGNHELVHVYHIELWKAGLPITPRFEIDIEGRRQRYINFFMDMPFALRTPGGTLLQHSGASHPFSHYREEEAAPNLNQLRNWDHLHYLERLALRAGLSPDQNLNEQLHPTIGTLFRSFPFGNFLWEFLMNKNEKQYGVKYEQMIGPFLDHFSEPSKPPLTCMINGHVQEPKGAKVIGKRQLRLSSSKGAASRSLKKYVLIDGNRTYADANELMTGVKPLYP